MKAVETRLVRYLEGSNRRFIIPIYQRNYDWEILHCKRLLDDLIFAFKEKRKHFIGSIVSVYNEEGKHTEFMIIDGQQRLTTLSLLFLAISNSNYSSKEEKDKIKNEYLMDKYSEDKKLKLKLIKGDNEAFQKLFEEKNDLIESSNITQNYLYFLKRIKEEKISIKELIESIENLMIVDITLQKEDDPQLIFESLNSTGLDLKEADKVRNFILMKEPPETQEKLYELYWKKIEGNTQNRVSEFIRDYLTMKENKIPNKAKVYLDFKEYVLKEKLSNESILEELYKFSKYYGILIKTNHQNKKINEILKRINDLEVVVSYPFMLEILDDQNEEILTEEELIEIVETLESFSFRRTICNVNTNSLNKIFMNLAKEIKKNEDFKEKYVEIFKYILINKTEGQRFPKDYEFENKFILRNIYGFQSKNNYIFLKD
jgi:uncharacterized protein with ParB-like and HNH nuclease domain